MAASGWAEGGGASASVHQGLVSAGPGTVNIRDINYNSVPHAPSPKQTLRDSLSFKKIQFRERAIENAHEGTCSWLLDTEQYKQWISTDRTDWRHRLLWIKAKAGAGKSTLMKFAVEHARDNSHLGFVLPHFFNARGSDPLEYSTEGLYRTLLVWLLDELPPESVAKLERRFRVHGDGEWAIPELVRLLKAAMADLGASTFTFYVDALDECDVEDIRKMLRVFSDIVKQAWNLSHEVRVCFASRPYPQIQFTNAVFINLSDQGQHLEDIARYVNDNLSIGESPQARSIRSQLQEKAAGVFMWAVLVVNMLNRQHENGHVGELQHRLAEIPDDLHALYAHTLQRFPEDREALLLCFRIILFTEWADVETVWWAVQLGLGKRDDDIGRMSESMVMDDMGRFIVHITKGFVEVNGWEPQFIHESVRDFILEESELQRLYGVQGYDEFEGQSHELLRDLCVVELIARRPQIMEAVVAQGQAAISSRQGWYPYHISWPRFGFAPHAIGSLWWHTERAQECGRDQTSFLDSLLERIGPYLLSQHIAYREDPPEDRVYIAFRSVISVLLYEHCPMLIRQTQLQQARRFRRSNHAFGLVERGSPHFDLTESFEDSGPCLGALVDVYLRLEPRHPDLQGLLDRLAQSIPGGNVEFDEEPPNYGPLLNLHGYDVSAANFFLLALAPARALESHLDVLQNFATTSEPHIRFVHTLRFFIEEAIPTDGIELVHRNTLRWAINMNSADLAYRGSAGARWIESRLTISEHVLYRALTHLLYDRLNPDLKAGPCE